MGAISDVISARLRRIRLNEEPTSTRAGVDRPADVEAATVLTRLPASGPTYVEDFEEELQLPDFAILSPLARGAMSCVYTGMHRESHQRFAVKVVRIQPSQATSLRDRVELESRVIRSVEHPNVARGFGFGILGSAFYVVMELIQGVSLKRLVEDDGVLSARQAAEYISQAAAGLAAAHAEGIVHRDIKPSNLLLDTEGVIKVIDFGMARVNWPEQSSITLEYGDTLLGTVDYMAPEQAGCCHEADARADVYALGCTLYFLLTGRPPFPEGTITERLIKHCNARPTPLRQLRPDLPADLIAVCETMMAKQPDDRFQSAHEVRNALQDWLKSSSRVRRLSGEESSMYADILDRTTPSPTPIEEILRERKAINLSFARIRKAFFLSSVRTDDAHVSQVLASELSGLLDHVALLFTLDPADSASDIATTCPHLALEADLLSGQRDELFMALSDLAEKAEESRRHAPEWATDWKLESEFVDFESRFLEHQIREAEFTNHTLYDEIGVGD
jgi:serine/threonine protein kinase